MDADRFETLLRSLSGSPSRRSALGLLAGSALGSMLTKGAAPTEAKRKKKKKKKKPVAISPPPLSATCVEGQRPCNGACIPSNQCCTDSECGDVAPRCCRGTCLRPGECCLDNECSPDKVCRTGGCVCPSGQEEIGGVCGTRPQCEGPFGSCTCPDTLDRCTNTVCCADFCRQNPTTSVFFCTHSSAGKRCRSTEDCSTGLTCRGFVCTA